jgi:hypothetical protein
MEDDGLGCWGCRQVKEKLAQKGEHVSRYATVLYLLSFSILSFSEILSWNFFVPLIPRQLQLDTPQCTRSTIMDSGIQDQTRSGASMDMEKTLQLMGIAVWGINDKFSQIELILQAVPDARDVDILPTIYLQLVHRRGGMSVIFRSL